MAIRKDVWSLAEKLSEKSHICADHVYDFLMETGRKNNKNPKLLSFGTKDGMIWLESNPNAFFIMKMLGEQHSFRFTDTWESDFYWDAIMEKQEQYMD